MLLGVLLDKKIKLEREEEERKVRIGVLDFLGNWRRVVNGLKCYVNILF